MSQSLGRVIPTDARTCGCIRGEGGENLCFCPVKGIVDTISRRFALSIIGLVGNHVSIRFKDILIHFQGISPNTVAMRLRELEKTGLVSRKAFAEIPPRVEYSLTRKGSELREAIKPLMRWASKSA